MQGGNLKKWTDCCACASSKSSTWSGQPADPYSETLARLWYYLRRGISKLMPSSCLSTFYTDSQVGEVTHGDPRGKKGKEKSKKTTTKKSFFSWFWSQLTEPVAINYCVQVRWFYAQRDDWLLFLNGRLYSVPWVKVVRDSLLNSGIHFLIICSRNGWSLSVEIVVKS